MKKELNYGFRNIDTRKVPSPKKTKFDDKTLSEITGIAEERLLGIIKRKHASSEAVFILKLAFGVDFKDKCNSRNLNANQREKFSTIINDIKRANQRLLKRNKLKYEGKTLAKITKHSIKDLKIVMARKHKKAQPYKLIIEMFGSDYSKPFEEKRLNDKDRKRFFETVIALKKQLTNLNQREYRKSSCENKTLMEIINCSYEVLIEALNLVSKETKTYALYLRLFGEDFKGCYIGSKLSLKEKNLFNSGIKVLKRKANLIKERENSQEQCEYLYPDDLFAKSPFFREPFITIVKFIPTKYRDVTELYLGTKDGYMHSKESVAMIFRKDIAETETLIEKGLLIFRTLVDRSDSQNKDEELVVLSRHKNVEN